MGNLPLKVSLAQAREMQLQVEPVAVHNLPVELTAPGVVEANPSLTTPVISLVPGIVEEVKVQQGDEVKRGQLLVSIHSDQVGLIEGELVSKLLELQAERRQLEVRMHLAGKIYQRKKLLYAEQIAAEADVEIAENELALEQAAVRALDEKRDAAIETTRQRLNLFGIASSEVERIVAKRTIQHKFEIRSPRSGVVTFRDADPGEMIEGGKPLFVVADLSNVWLTAQVPEKDISLVTRGNAVRANIDSFPKEVFSGTLSFIDSKIQPETRTMAVRASIDNRERKLKPEMFGKLTLQTDTVKAMFVPSSAVQEVGEASVVYVQVAPNEFKEIRVETGRTIGSNVEITQGLRGGETIATTGSLKLLGMALQRLSVE
jgi:cobalt-zinc-cadmium efflux system membrane fusion protein